MENAFVAIGWGAHRCIRPQPLRLYMLVQIVRHGVFVSVCLACLRVSVWMPFSPRSQRRSNIERTLRRWFWKSPHIHLHTFRIARPIFHVATDLKFIRLGIV